MIYQGEIIYIIKYQLLLLERIQGGGGLRVLKTPPRLRRGVSDPPPGHNNVFTIANCERFKCDGRVLERNDSYRIKEYVHCSSNGHNLSVVKAMSVPQTHDMKGTGNKLVIFCKYCNGQLASLPIVKGGSWQR